MKNVDIIYFNLNKTCLCTDERVYEEFFEVNKIHAQNRNLIGKKTGNPETRFIE